MFKRWIKREEALKIIDEFREEIRILNKELNAFKKVQGIIEAITKQGIQWFDYSKLNLSEQRNYYQEAQDALNNTAIKNEMNKIINESAEWALKQSENFEGVKAMRFTVSGMKLILERLEDIPNPDVKDKETEEPFNAI
jgi:hypothetical protein